MAAVAGSTYDGRAESSSLLPAFVDPIMSLVSLRPLAAWCLSLSLLIAFSFTPRAGAQAESENENEKPRRPNIVVILADDLGYADLGCFGQTMFATPRLDQMAAEGLRFTQFYAGSTVCAPSRCVLLTGKHAGRAKIRGNDPRPIALDKDDVTIASLLKGAGYKTACIGKWGVGSPANLTNPNDVGFDHFFGYISAVHAHNSWPEFLIRNGEVVRLRNEVAEKWKPHQDPNLPGGGRGAAVKQEQFAQDLFVDDSLRFIRENAKGPFFLFLSLNTPHVNNEAGEIEVPDFSQFADRDWPEAEKRYAALVQRIDRDAGRVLDLLRELKIDRETLVVFSADNGPHNKGGHDPAFFNSTGKMRGIKRDLLEGGIRMPTIAWWPGTTPPQSENDRQWYQGDLLATAAELAGAELPAGHDSDSLVEALQGEVNPNQWGRKSPLYWEFYEGAGSQAVRFGKWKALRSPLFDGEIELYDMSNDIGEKRDYAQRRPDLKNHAGNLLNKHHTPDPNWSLKGSKPAPAPADDAK